MTIASGSVTRFVRFDRAEAASEKTHLKSLQSAATKAITFKLKKSKLIEPGYLSATQQSSHVKNAFGSRISINVS